jgi:hypothetical protein
MDGRRWWRADADPDDRGTPLPHGAIQMSTSLPVAILVFLGALIAVLGLFAAGNIVVTIVGLLAVFGAGVLQVVGARVER